MRVGGLGEMINYCGHSRICMWCIFSKCGACVEVYRSLGFRSQIGENRRFNRNILIKNQGIKIYKST